MTILVSVLVVLNIQNYFSYNCVNKDKVVSIKEYKEIGINQKNTLAKEKKVYAFISKVKIIKPKREIQDIEFKQEELNSDDNEYIDFEDAYAEAKAYNQNIDFVKSSEVVNITSEFEKDATRQMIEYMEPK